MPMTFAEYKRRKLLDGKKSITKKRLRELRDFHWRYPCSTGFCNICEIEQKISEKSIKIN